MLEAYLKNLAYERIKAFRIALYIFFFQVIFLYGVKAYFIRKAAEFHVEWYSAWLCAFAGVLAVHLIF
jgi:hypothetical protein